MLKPKKLKAGSFIHHEEWNMGVDYAKRTNTHNINSLRKNVPVQIVPDRDYPKYSAFGLDPDSANNLTDEVRSSVGDNAHYLTNGPFELFSGSIGWAWFISEAVKINVFNGFEPTVGEHCGIYKDKIHKDYVGFVCLSAELQDGTVWVMKSVDNMFVAQVFDSVQPFRERKLLLGEGSVKLLS